MIRRIQTAAWFLLISGICSGAAAQSASASANPSADDEVARGLFQAGKAAYEGGNYDDAVQFFEQAYQRSGRAQLLFNIGQVADRLRQDDKALRSFREYLRLVPEATNRAEVESRITALEHARAARDAAATQATTPAPAAPTPAQTAQAARPAHAASAPSPAPTESDAAPQPVTKQWWFWGIGAVVLGGTAVALAVALSSGDAGQEAPYQGNAGSFEGP